MSERCFYTEMPAEQLIGYCEIHCETERALFPKEMVAQMVLLAGEPDHWAKPEAIISHAQKWYSLHGEMKELISLASPILHDTEFLKCLVNIDKFSEKDAMRALYAHVYPLLEEGCFGRTSIMIKNFTTHIFTYQLCVAFLTVTYSKRDKLGNRPQLLSYAKEAGAKEGFTQKQIASTLNE